MAVHTLRQLRESSTILLTAILAASAKFFHRTMRPALLSHAQTILNRSLLVGECSTGTIQALLLLSAWKEPTDKSSWVKMGIAIRLGYQLGLHIPRAGPLPVDAHQARLLIDSERTWIVLSCKYCNSLTCFRANDDRLRSIVGSETDRIVSDCMTDLSYSDIFSLPQAIRPEHVGDVSRTVTREKGDS